MMDSKTPRRIACLGLLAVLATLSPFAKAQTDGVSVRVTTTIVVSEVSDPSMVRWEAADPVTLLWEGSGVLNRQDDRYLRWSPGSTRTKTLRRQRSAKPEGLILRFHPSDY